MPRFRTAWLQTLTHIGAWLPLLLLAWDFTQGQLTANPIREIQFRTGRYALTLLVLSLACTPVSAVFGLKQALALRRTLGLYAFMYASLHFLNFVVVDYGFDFSLIREDISEKRFALAGFATFLCLLPLAVTSTEGWQKRLGANWQRLHRLAYLASLLAVLHFTWQVKSKADIGLPLLYGVIVLVLLMVRLPIVRKVAKRLRGPGK